jgi:two-component system OmpR family response regulator
MTKVLLVEDDQRIARFIKHGLEAESYVVDIAERGAGALDRCRDIDYPLIILDRMLPDMDGLDVCRRLREDAHGACILMLTARDARQDKVEGLRVGADDYLTKPFAEASPLLQLGDLTLNAASRRVARGGREIALTAREFALLRYLMANAGKAVSRTKLLANVWEYGFDPGTKIVDVYIRYLRSKIDPAGEKPLIRTIRGVGYSIAAD